MAEEFKATVITPAAFTLPLGILQQDFEIIDEQENHVVLTARLLIDMIRDNVPFLMALSEIVTGTTPRPPVEPEGAEFVMPAGILQQDAVIIAEQEDHIVMTVRLSIDLIRDNRPLLMALSEIASHWETKAAGRAGDDLDDAE